MVNVNYDAINEEYFKNYFKFLTNKLFKILPIYEQEPSTLKDYLSSLLIEIIGSDTIAKKIKYDADFLTMMAIIQYLIDNECSHDVCRREVFKAIKIVEKLQKNIKEESK